MKMRFREYSQYVEGNGCGTACQAIAIFCGFDPAQGASKFKRISEIFSANR
jgi:hypothetical protein